MHEVRRGDADRRTVRIRMRAEGDAGVVGDVQPLVAVRRPRVGALRSAHEVTKVARCSRPESECTVDVEPRARSIHRVGDRAEVVERTRVHFACLPTDDCRHVPETGKLADAHAALIVSGDDGERRRADAEQAESTVDSDMPLRADHDTDRRRADEPVLRDIPPRLLENMLARDGECGDMGHLASGHERCGCAGRKAEELHEPAACHLLCNRRRRPAGVETRVLVPSARHPVGRQRRGDGASDDEAEVAP